MGILISDEIQNFPSKQFNTHVKKPKFYSRLIRTTFLCKVRGNQSYDYSLNCTGSSTSSQTQ